MIEQAPDSDKRSFLLPSGCHVLADVLQLKRQRADRRAGERAASRAKVEEAFSGWVSSAVHAARSEALDAEFYKLNGLFLDMAALLTRSEKSQLEKRIARYPLSAATHRKIMKAVVGSRPR